MKPVSLPPGGTNKLLTIGQVAARTGVAVSAVRFYADSGLVPCVRSSGGKRLFRRHVIRRISFILIAQQLGYSLDVIGQHLQTLQENRTPTKRDWDRLAVGFKRDIDARIDKLVQLRDSLSSCIGCGCLSLQRCHLYNREDIAAENGSGPRYLLGDTAPPPD